MKGRNWIIFIIMIFCLLACTGKRQVPVDGHWRAAWTSSGGEIPVDLFLKTNESGDIEAEVHNDIEVVKFSRVSRIGNQLDFFIDRYESHIHAELSADGKSMAGNWSKQTGSPNQMPFAAVKGDLERFPRDRYYASSSKAARQNVSGNWKLRFEGDELDSVGIFRQQGEKVTGTIRCIDGDFRWLEGVYRSGLFLLSSFNGSWVFLFKAEMDENGRLNGIWARGPRKPVKWTASLEEPSYPDSFQLTKLSNRERLLRFTYPSVEEPQKRVSNSDPQFRGKPFLAAFLLTGCPNSQDAGDLLSQICDEYNSQGLNLVCIFYEITKDEEIIRSRVRRFLQEHRLPSMALFSLAMNKPGVVLEIPDFQDFLAWPTVVFYGPDGKVDCIHTGIDGPATGDHYLKVMQEYRTRVEKLLAQRQD